MTTQAPPLFPELEPIDVCARKHGGNRNSEAAHERVVPHTIRMRELIWQQVNVLGFHGCTINELRIWDYRHSRFKPANELSPRLTELKSGNFERVLYDSGRRRESCTVYVSKPEWRNGSMAI